MTRNERTLFIRFKAETIWGINEEARRVGLNANDFVEAVVERYLTAAKRKREKPTAPISTSRNDWNDDM